MDFDEKPKKGKPEKDGTPYRWYQVWQMVLARPGVATFEEILRDPYSTRRRAYNWIVAVIWLVLLAIYAFIILQSPNYAGILLREFPLYLVRSALVSLIVLAGFIISTMIVHIGARILGGRGAYNDFAYATAAINAPLTAINGILWFFGASTALVLLVLFLGLYQFILTVMAVKAVHGFGWLKAILSPLIVGLLFSGFVFLLVVTR